MTRSNSFRHRRTAAEEKNKINKTKGNKVTHNNSLTKINSARFTSNAARSLAALSGFLIGAASKTKVLSGSVALATALIAGMSILGSETP